MADDPRGIVPKIITRFRGISQYRSIAGQPMEWAQDLNNVIVSGAGFLEKFRSPLLKAPLNPLIPGGGDFIDMMYDFSQANGTRQLFCNFRSALGYYTEPAIGFPYVFTLIEAVELDTPRFSFVDANNLLFMTNGRRMAKWTGTGMQNWGIIAPVAPTLDNVGMKLDCVSATRAANVTSFVLAPAPGIFNNFLPGDLVRAVGWDASFNGIFQVVSWTPGTSTITVANVGANGASVAVGTLSFFSMSMVFTQAVTIGRQGGVVTMQFGSAFNPGKEITIAGLTTNDAGVDVSSLNGTFRIATVVAFGTYTWLQSGPDIAPGLCNVNQPTITGGVTDIISNRLYGYSYKNSVTGEESNITLYPQPFPVMFVGGVPLLFTNRQNFLVPTVPPDPQVDIICWYGTLDAGADWFFLDEVPLNGASVGQLGPNHNTYADQNTDNTVDTSRRGSFINFPPPLSRYLSKWQDRIYMVPVSNPQSIVYSGYEKILVGRPESAFPPGNQIQFKIGAQIIQAHAALMNGVVIWDNADRMFMFKGTVEDIVTSQPVAYSEQVEEMPWQVGNYSHAATVSTPQGVIWFGSDKAFHKWNGIFYGEIIGPTDISQNIAPLLRRITKGTETNVQADYFNFLERDWYVALIAIDGSQSYNRILFFDMAKDVEDNLGIFVSDIKADSLAVRIDAAGTRHLLISYKGVIYEIKSESTATAGVHTNITSTDQLLNAFWLSGYEGNDNPMERKMFRFGRLITDQTGFNLLVTIVNDADSTLANPNWTKLITEQDFFPGGKYTINWKGVRCSVKIIFPPQDCDASVIQLSLAHFPLGEK